MVCVAETIRKLLRTIFQLQSPLSGPLAVNDPLIPLRQPQMRERLDELRFLWVLLLHKGTSLSAHKNSIRLKCDTVIKTYLDRETHKKGEKSSHRSHHSTEKSRFESSWSLCTRKRNIQGMLKEHNENPRNSTQQRRDYVPDTLTHVLVLLRAISGEDKQREVLYTNTQEIIVFAEVLPGENGNTLRPPMYSHAKPGFVCTIRQTSLIIRRT